MQRPREGDEVEEPERQATDKHAEEMMGLLREKCSAMPGGALPLAEVVCNPRCFAQTVENLFALQFIVQ